MVVSVHVARARGAQALRQRQRHLRLVVEYSYTSAHLMRGRLLPGAVRGREE